MYTCYSCPTASLNINAMACIQVFSDLREGGLAVLRMGYSRISAYTWLKPHFGMTNGQLKIHLGLIVPSTDGKRCVVTYPFPPHPPIHPRLCLISSTSCVIAVNFRSTLHLAVLIYVYMMRCEPGGRERFSFSTTPLSTRYGIDVVGTAWLYRLCSYIQTFIRR